MHTNEMKLTKRLDALIAQHPQGEPTHFVNFRAFPILTQGTADLICLTTGQPKKGPDV
jgi:hypothetical protein